MHEPLLIDQTVWIWDQQSQRYVPYPTPLGYLMVILIVFIFITLLILFQN